MHTRARHATTAGVTTGSNASAAAKNWEAIRADPAIQFAPVPPAPAPKTPEPPQWLSNLGEWLGDWMKPVAQWLVAAWPVLKWVLIGIAVLCLVLIAWRLLQPLLGWRPQPKEDAPEWTPDRDEALSLLDDADALAAAGRYDEATHLLLIRSVGQIRAARPDWLEPSSTAREIAALPSLPDRARTAFSAIAERVERSLFALRTLDADDWQVARSAYADFALARIDGAQLDRSAGR